MSTAELDLDELERIGNELPSHVGIAFGIDTALNDRPKFRAFLRAAELNWQPMIDEIRRLRAERQISAVEFESISRLSAWIRDYGSQKESAFIDDLCLVIEMAKGQTVSSGN